MTSGCTEEIPTCDSDTEDLVTDTDPTGGVTYRCVPRGDGEGEPLPTPEEIPDGSGQQNIQYICETVQNPNGCLFPDSFNKLSAEATYRNLSPTGDAILHDDPARLGWGICYFTP